MEITRTGVALLVGAAFAAGVGVGPGGNTLAREFGIPPAAAGVADQQQAYSLLRLFGNVFDRVRAKLPRRPPHPTAAAKQALLGAGAAGPGRSARRQRDR